jgi:hypothetical protein
MKETPGTDWYSVNHNGKIYIYHEYRVPGPEGPRRSTAPSSEEQLQSELADPRILRPGDGAESAGRNRVVGSVEIRAIQQVEELGPELRLQLLAAQRELLEQYDQSGSNIMMVERAQ